MRLRCLAFCSADPHYTCAPHFCYEIFFRIFLGKLSSLGEFSAGEKGFGEEAVRAQKVDGVTRI